jgi:hypothetical protein
VHKKFKKEGDKWVPISSEHSEFPEWIEIFATGTWTSAEGVTNEWSLEDLQEIVSSYDAVNSPAPIVIGHPETDSPAYGWIEALKVEGEKLLAKPGQLIDEFVDWVKRGLYKKISMAIYPDLTLKHVGFLGGTPPAVKGLKPVSFKTKKVGWTFEKEIEMAEGDREKEKQTQEARSKKYGIAIKEGGNVTKPGEWANVDDDDFLDPVNYRYPCPNADQTQAAAAYWGKEKNQEQYSSEERAIINKRLASKEKQYKIGEHSEKGAKKMDLGKFFSDLKALVIGAEKELVPDDPGRKFTEADVQAAEKRGKDLTFAEVEKERKEKEEAQKKLKEIEDKKRKDDIASFCETLCKDGKLTPALRKIIEPVMIAVSEIPDMIEFSEGVKKSRLEGIKDFLTELPKAVTFREVTPKEGPGSNGSAGEKLSALTKKKMEEKKDLSYSLAFAEVQKENPELAKEYLAEIKPKT